MTAERYPVRIVVPVWGQNYIDLMSRIMLPSLLSSGNIPAVADEMRIEFLFITQSSSRDIIENSPAVQALKRYAEYSFLYIDEYFSNNYGMILTRAYFDSVIKFKDTARDYLYFFFNVDTVISSGSLASVLKYIKQGKTLLFSPGVRVNAEAFFREAERFRGDDGMTLDIGARDLAAVALRNLHGTVLAQRMSHRFTHLLRPYQFYWQSRPDVLQVAAFLMANICFKPTSIPEAPPCFVDYCIAEVFCPGTEITVIPDSDEFLLIEPQVEGWMMDEVRGGMMSEDEFARFFSGWVTPQHIELGRTVVTIHADDLTQQDRCITEEATVFACRLAGQMTPQPYEGHPYWKCAKAAEQASIESMRKAEKGPVREQLTHAKPILRVDSLEADRTSLHRLYNAMFGTAPKPHFYHPSLVQYEPVLNFFAEQRKRRRLVILLGEGGTWYLPENGKDQKTYKVLDLDGLVNSPAEQGRKVYEEMMGEVAVAECIFFRASDHDMIRHEEIVSFFAGRVQTDCRIGIFYAGAVSALLQATDIDILGRILRSERLRGGVTFSGTLTGMATTCSLGRLARLLANFRARKSAVGSISGVLLYGAAFAIAFAVNIPFNLMKRRFVRPKPFIGGQSIFFDLSPMPKAKDSHPE